MDETRSATGRDGGATALAIPGDAANIHRDLIRISRSVRTHAGDGSLSPGQLSALWTIAEHGPIRATELAELECVAAPTMSRVLATLERNEMVQRTTDPHDGRVCLLTPTTTGLGYLHGSSSRKTEVFAAALDRLDPDDRAAVTRSMHLLADTMNELDAPEPPTADVNHEEGA